MGNFDIEVDVDEDKIHEQLEDAIEDGIEEAASEIGEEAQHVAEDKIISEGAIWSGDLLESFDNYVEHRRDGIYVKIENDSDHAQYQEHGAEYDTEGPPIKKLLPWVRSELSHMKVESDYVDYVVGMLGIELTSWTDQEIAKAYWLSQKIKREGLEPVRFMATAKKYLDRHADDHVSSGIEESLKKSGFL